ncbi:MAG: hypothetical protein M1835_003148 [Candelina submexicana]|nr:MAG: hypothetical protein M1835_003148 [Candelina submexicana]
MLTSKIRLPPNSTNTPEDILSSSLHILYPDDLCNQHGEPGSQVIYTSSQFGDIELRLADPQGEEQRLLFSHYLWNAGVLLAELLGNDGVDEIDENAGGGPLGKKWSVKGERVLELGAGTGLGGIISVFAGAERVVITDYPAPEILSNISTNISKNIPSVLKPHVSVQGHEWGTLAGTFSTTHKGVFTRILAADCLWMPWQHRKLVLSMLHFLSMDENARVYVVAGFHTGRAKVAAFFDVVLDEGLEVELVQERDAEGGEREWMREMEGEGITERKRWLVVAALRRKRQ